MPEATKYESIANAFGPYVLLITLVGTMVFLFHIGLTEIAGVILGMLVIPGTKLLLGINNGESYEPNDIDIPDED